MIQWSHTQRFDAETTSLVSLEDLSFRCATHRRSIPAKDRLTPMTMQATNIGWSAILSHETMPRRITLIEESKYPTDFSNSQSPE